MTRRGWIFIIVSAGFAWLGVQRSAWLTCFLFWLGANFLIIGIAYIRRKHGIFGKRMDGTLPLWSWAFFWPYLSYSLLVWHALRLLSREPAHGVVSADIFVGRRLLPHEVPEGIVNYVDLTAEFREPHKIRCGAGYVNFPILDGGAPSPESLVEFTSKLKPGRTFIHCAQGHGRTGLFALALLLSRGTASSIEQGMMLLQGVRPGIRLNAEQVRCVEGFISLISKREAQ